MDTKLFVDIIFIVFIFCLCSFSLVMISFYLVTVLTPNKKSSLYPRVPDINKIVGIAGEDLNVGDDVYFDRGTGKFMKFTD